LVIHERADQADAGTGGRGYGVCPWYGLVQDHNAGCIIGCNYETHFQDIGVDIIMFSSHEQRMIKELLLFVYRKMPKALHWSVYYIPHDTKLKTDKLATLVRGMHALPQIPWPDDNCVIISHDAASKIFQPITNMETLVAVVHEKRMSRRFNTLPKTENIGHIEPMRIFNAFYFDNAIHCLEDAAELFHMTRSQDRWSGGQSFEESLQKNLMRVVSALGGRPKTVPEAIKEEYLQWSRLSNPYGLDDFWSCYRHNVSTQKPEEQVGFAGDIFSCLANIVVPCHYFVKSRFVEGFGTSSMRKIMRAKPIFSIVNFDRLYRVYGGNGDHEVSPHFRRGHIRHLWKEAGLNRFLLPRDTIERIRLVSQNNVRRVYVAPSWVGETCIEIDGISHQIELDDFELPGL